MHTCLACGLTDYEVRMALVMVPPDEQRIVPVAVTTLEDSHGRPLETRTDQVREIYANEPRCRDRAACAVRVAEAEAQMRERRAEDLAWLG